MEVRLEGWARTRAGAMGWEERDCRGSGGQVDGHGDCCLGGEVWLEVPALD